MENSYDSVLVLKKYKLDTIQSIIENNITVEDVEISKVLSVGADIDLDTTQEMLSNACNLNGKMILNIIYTNQDGEINNQTAVSPFSIKLSNENIDVATKLNAKVKVVATQIDKVMGNQINVISTLNCDCVLIKNEEMQYLLSTEENIYTKQAEQKVTTFNKQICEKFEENLQATVKDGVKKVLMTNVECILKDWSAGTGFVGLEGEIYAKVVYVNKQEIPELETITISKNFKQELDAEGLTKDSDLEVFLNVIYEQIKIELDEHDTGETIIDINVPFIACYNEICSKCIMTVVDAYSTANQLSLFFEEQQNYTSVKPVYLEGKIEGNVVLTDNEPRIDKYLATTNVCNQVSNTYINDGVLYIEGIVSANVVYLNDELSALQSVEIEIPYVLDKKVDFDNVDILDANVKLFDVDVMVKRGREIYFDAKAKAFVNVAKANTLSMISKAENKEPLPNRDVALEIYFAKAGESFWNIAKNLKIPTEIIANQNETLSDPLEKDENIAIYYQKQRNG